MSDIEKEKLKKLEKFLNSSNSKIILSKYKQKEETFCKTIDLIILIKEGLELNNYSNLLNYSFYDDWKYEIDRFLQFYEKEVGK